MSYPQYEIYPQGPYKYRMTSRYELDITPWGFVFEKAIIRNRHKRIVAEMVNGLLIIREGFAWDGPSGPALDTIDFARASLVHDALYQMAQQKNDETRMRWKKRADKALLSIAKEDGMPWWRARYCYWAVKYFGKARDGYLA